MAPTRYRRVRVLIYEADDYEWVEQSSESAKRFVKGNMVLTTKTPFHEPFEIRAATEKPVPDKMITEFLTNIEEIS